MKNRLKFAVLIASFAACGQALAADITGTWNDTETSAVFSIYSCGSGVCAKIVKPKEPGSKDYNNPDPALKGRPMEGIVLLSNGQKESEGKYKGTLYNPEDGNTYTGYLTLTNTNEVKLEGCVLGGLICKSRVWKRGS
jgi:uncharacterized protein (DUF2147 family)